MGIFSSSLNRNPYVPPSNASSLGRDLKLYVDYNKTLP